MDNPVREFKPKHEQHALHDVEVDVTSAPKAAIYTDLIVPPGVRLLNTPPWLTSINVGSQH